MTAFKFTKVKGWLLAMPVVLTFLIEAILRCGFGLGNPILIVSDAACEYTLKPGQDVWRFHARTKINRYGMRSDEIAEKRPSGVMRILFVGDSLTYGTTRVDQGDIFTERLHRDLPAIVRSSVEVLNASASGWAPGNELSYLRSRGTFDSNVLVLVLNDGDLTQPRSKYQEVRSELPVSRPVTAIGEVYVRYLRPLVAGVLEYAHARSRTTADFRGSDFKSEEEILLDNLADLEEIREVCASDKGLMVVVFVPFPGGLPGTGAVAGNELHTWCDEHNVRMIDLSMAEAIYSPPEITLRDGIHLNAMGHWMVAQAIEKGWVKATEWH